MSQRMRSLIKSKSVIRKLIETLTGIYLLQTVRICYEQYPLVKLNSRRDVTMIEGTDQNFVESRCLNGSLVPRAIVSTIKHMLK